MTGRKVAGEEPRGPGDSNVADYKVILRRVSRQPAVRGPGSSLRRRWARTAPSSPRSPIQPIWCRLPAKHVAIIFEVCHLSGAEARGISGSLRERAHPGPACAGIAFARPRTRTIAVTVPDLGDDKKNRALEQTRHRFLRRSSRAYAEERRLTDSSKNRK